MTTKGKVYLVGAGPGDPGLITVKGLRCLTEADVVVYDRLASPQLLRKAPPHAEMIFRGPRKGDPMHEQEAINQIIVQKALEGKQVVRLKGGDPFVFGRGGEEALTLVEHDIPFEVVPGITAAIAASAYAGIPVTHRGLSTSLSIVTGHEDPTKKASQIDWQRLARDHATLVFYMSAGNLPMISSRLIKEGLDPTTPAAFVSWGTTALQKTILGTLQNLPDKVSKAGLSSPALTIVGSVAKLHEKLAWYHKRPLAGKCIVVARNRRSSGALAEPLRALGAEVMEIPAISIEPLDDYGPLDAAIRQINAFDWMIFTSANGVEGFFERLTIAGQDSRALAGIRIVSIGPGTTAALEAVGLRPDLKPDRHVAESVLEKLLEDGEVKGKNFLLPRSRIARAMLPDALRQNGAQVTDAPAYDTRAPEDLPALIKEVMQRPVDMAIFTSSSCVRNFIKAMHQVKLAPDFAIASIGSITSAEVRKLGLDVDVEAGVFTISGLISAVLKYYEKAP